MIGNIIISLLFILIGIEEITNGADPGSRFYYIDNIIVRVLGLCFIILSIGLLLRKEFARKGIVVVCLVSMLEALATYDYSNPLLDIIMTFIIFALILLAPLIFFLNPKVKLYFSSSKDELNSNYNYNNLNYKHSGVGTASFIIAVINILSTILVSVQLATSKNYIESAGQPIIGLLIVFVLVSCIIGLPLGIAGLFSRNTKKSLSIWGTIINGLFVIFLILVVLVASLNYQEINDIINESFQL
jgi:hypothetical protein